MTYDNTLKYLVEQFPDQFVRWLLGSEPDEIQILKTELSLEPIRADAMTFLKTASQILHLEVQTLPTSTPLLLLRTQVNMIEATAQQQSISAYVQLVAGLILDKKIIQQLFRRDIMRESVIYQEILQEGEQKGREEGREEGRQAQLKLVLRLLQRQLQELDPTLQAQVEALPLSQLTDLGEASLDFGSEADLVNWLNQAET